MTKSTDQHDVPTPNEALEASIPEVRELIAEGREQGYLEGERVREALRDVDITVETTDEIRPASLPDFEVESRLRQGDGPAAGAGGGSTGALSESLVQFERELILAAINRSGGNLNKAAAQLDLSRHALRYRMSRLSLQVDGGVDDEAE